MNLGVIFDKDADCDEDIDFRISQGQKAITKWLLVEQRLHKEKNISNYCRGLSPLQFGGMRDKRRTT